MRRLSFVTTLRFLPRLALVLLAAGCAWPQKWNRLSVPGPAALPDTLPRNEVVQIWTSGSGHPQDWWGVIISHDSVTGTPNTRHPCCRIGVPLTNVDSTRVGSDNTWSYVALGALVVSGVVLLVVGDLQGR